MNINTQESDTSVVVGSIDEFEVGEMKMKSIGEHRIAVIRTSSGIHALDNACPHQGYGLTTGSLDDDLITCQWHNWKFEASTGRCVVGEEDVQCHPVVVSDDGQITVSVIEESNSQRQARLWPSLARAIADSYVGQLSRDVVRLLETGATPAQIMWAGLEPALAQSPYGPGHEFAFATDCLSITMERTGDDRALPLVQGLAALAEASRGRPRRTLPAPDATIDFQTAIEAEDVEGAMAATVYLIEAGATPEQVRREFITAVARHHLGYGHGIIYTQKSFELLEIVGWEHAASVLPHLAVSITYSTREDTLPYMRKAMSLIDNVDLAVLAASRRWPGWTPDVELVDVLLDGAAPPIPEVVSAALDGAGVEGILDAITIGSSRRLLRHDLAVEFSDEEPVQWLDITHALTMSRAVRWAWASEPGEAAARLVLFATWLLHDSGRAERRVGIARQLTPTDTTSTIQDAIRSRDVAAALGSVADSHMDVAARQLQQASLEDPSGAFIVLAHLVKLTRAATEEADVTGSRLPLLAACRYLASPKREAFVGRNVAESLGFVRSGRPPRR